MFVVTGREMAALDAAAQQEYGLPGLVLMENAGREVAGTIEARYGSPLRVAVVCGPGNNGGDGLVAARHLYLRGHRVEVWLLAEEEAYRGDALVNLKAARAIGLLLRRVPEEEEAFREILRKEDVILDACFGTGFSGAPRPGAAAAIRAINAAGRPVVAVDIPSGVEADTGAVRGEAVRAALTVTFALPKLGCLLYPGAAYCGELVVVPISLPLVAREEKLRRRIIEERDAADLLPDRPKDAHKGLAGRVLIVGGSPGLTGAPFLAARGALRAGAGLVTAILPAGLAAVEKTAAIMLGTLPGGPDGGFAPEAAETLAPWLARADVLALGPGLGQGPGARALLLAVAAEWWGPLVLDADGLNVLATTLELARGGHGPWILTPHPGEMARLLGIPVAEVQADRVGHAERAAAAWQAVVVLKGVPTVVAAPDGRTWLNPTGHPAMATGGMGDVLTGVIAGLMAQGMEPVAAAVVGVYLHGLAGEIAAADRGGIGILAGEVADAVPAAMGKVKNTCRVTRS
ncbi:MAG: NAD(P)H-hydrate dehydratase [Firmicutes bacterium]|nr:NAD(P)H-hydrate dehydratase [Bacillota bacterium]